MRSAERNFALTPPGKRAWISLIGLMIALPLLLLAAVASGTLPGSDAIRTLLLVSSITIAAALAIGLLMRRRSVEFDGNRLWLRAALYTQSIPLGELDPEAARIVDLDERTELKPRLKTNGVELPGFVVGHYRAAGGTRLFAIVTDRRRVLALPEHGGRVLLLSLARPQSLLDALRASPPAATARIR